MCLISICILHHKERSSHQSLESAGCRLAGFSSLTVAWSDQWGSDAAAWCGWTDLGLAE